MNVIKAEILVKTYEAKANVTKMQAGYKMTELGILPEDWSIDMIVNQANITTGSRNTQDKIEEGQYPFFVRSQKIELIDSYAYDGEAILTAGDGVGTGKVFHYINGKFDFHQRVYSICNFSHCLNGAFFYYYFSSHFYDRIMSMTAKSSVDSVRRNMIAAMKIPLPPYDEQQSIAEVLQETEKLIIAQEELIAKKHDIKIATMQQLLSGNIRLPGFKDEWENKKLGQICKITKGQLITEKEAIPGFVPVIAGGKESSYSHNYSNKMPPVITISASGANAGFVSIHHTPIFASDCSTIENDNSYSINFIYYFLNLMQSKIYTMQTGGAQPHIHAKDILPIMVSLPCLKEQSAIADILIEMDAEILSLQKKLEKAKAIKQGMMQELLTGRIRLI